MTNHSLEALMIIDRGGAPKFYMQLDPRAFNMDPDLGSSFFAAIDMFSSQILDKSEKAVGHIFVQGHPSFPRHSPKDTGAQDEVVVP